MLYHDLLDCDRHTQLVGGNEVAQLHTVAAFKVTQIDVNRKY